MNKNSFLRMLGVALFLSTAQFSLAITTGQAAHINQLKSDIEKGQLNAEQAHDRAIVITKGIPRTASIVESLREVAEKKFGIPNILEDVSAQGIITAPTITTQLPTSQPAGIQAPSVEQPVLTKQAEIVQPEVVQPETVKQQVEVPQPPSEKRTSSDKRKKLIKKPEFIVSESQVTETERTKPQEIPQGTKGTQGSSVATTKQQAALEVNKLVENLATNLQSMPLQEIRDSCANMSTIMRRNSMELEDLDLSPSTSIQNSVLFDCVGQVAVILGDYIAAASGNYVDAVIENGKKSYRTALGELTELQKKCFDIHQKLTNNSEFKSLQALLEKLYPQLSQTAQISAQQKTTEQKKSQEVPQEAKIIQKPEQEQVKKELQKTQTAPVSIRQQVVLEVNKLVENLAAGLKNKNMSLQEIRDSFGAIHIIMRNNGMQPSDLDPIPSPSAKNNVLFTCVSYVASIVGHYNDAANGQGKESYRFGLEELAVLEKRCSAIFKDLTHNLHFNALRIQLETRYPRLLQTAQQARTPEKAVAPMVIPAQQLPAVQELHRQLAEANNPAHAFQQLIYDIDLWYQVSQDPKATIKPDEFFKLSKKIQNFLDLPRHNKNELESLKTLIDYNLVVIAAATRGGDVRDMYKEQERLGALIDSLIKKAE